MARTKTTQVYLALLFAYNHDEQTGLTKAEIRDQLELKHISALNEPIRNLRNIIYMDREGKYHLKAGKKPEKVELKGVELAIFNTVCANPGISSIETIKKKVGRGITTAIDRLVTRRYLCGVRKKNRTFSELFLGPNYIRFYKLDLESVIDDDQT